MRILLLLIWAVITGLCSYFQHQYCCNSTSEKTGAAATASANLFANDFQITGEDGWSATCPAGKFIRSNNELIADNAELQECLNAVASYQEEHPGQKWVVTGNYAPDETNTSIFNNLGEARAQQIKQQLTETFGLSPTLISLKSNLVDSSAFRNDTLFNGYSLSFGEKPADLASDGSSDSNSDLTVDPPYVNKFDRSTPIALRFNVNSSNPNMNSDIRSRFANLISDMENDASISLKLTGHTDTQGDPAYNLNLGKDRAETVKNYLVRNGISASRIQTESKGETQPIGNSDAVNRRVEVTIE